MSEKANTVVPAAFLDFACSCGAMGCKLWFTIVAGVRRHVCAACKMKDARPGLFLPVLPKSSDIEPEQARRVWKQLPSYSPQLAGQEMR